jgi:hypothetical protein
MLTKARTSDLRITAIDQPAMFTFPFHARLLEFWFAPRADVACELNEENLTSGLFCAITSSQTVYLFSIISLQACPLGQLIELVAQ